MIVDIVSIARGKERTFVLKVHRSTQVFASGQKYGEIMKRMFKFTEVSKSWKKSSEVLHSFKKCEQVL